jgi:probable addiction module antidote protein
MEKEKLTKWSIYDYLLTDSDMINYLNAVITENDKFLPKAIGTVLRAKRINNIALKTGLQRESLYKSFSDKGNPTYNTIIKVLNELGIIIKFELTKNNNAKYHEKLKEKV